MNRKSGQGLTGRQRGGASKRHSYTLPQLGPIAVFVATSYLVSRQAKSAGMGDPATVVEAATPPVVTAIPAVIAGEMQGEESLCSWATDLRSDMDKGVWRSLSVPGCPAAGLRTEWEIDISMV